MPCRLSRAPNPNRARFSFDGLVESFVQDLALAPLRRGHGVTKLLKRVQHRNACGLEMSQVAGYDGQPVLQGRCGDQQVGVVVAQPA